jgi:hypothetical protein
MQRRNFIKAGTALTMLNGLGVGKRKMFHSQLDCMTSVQDQQCRTQNQGPFGIVG